MVAEMFYSLFIRSGCCCNRDITGIVTQSDKLCFWSSNQLKKYYCQKINNDYGPLDKPCFLELLRSGPSLQLWERGRCLEGRVGGCILLMLQSANCQDTALFSELLNKCFVPSITTEAWHSTPPPPPKDCNFLDQNLTPKSPDAMIFSPPGIWDWDSQRLAHLAAKAGPDVTLLANADCLGNWGAAIWSNDWW